MIFITFFCEVVSEWKSKENGEDHRCSNSKVEMVFRSVDLLNHSASVYTIEAFALFEKEFVDGDGYKCKEVESVSCDRRFEVWGVRSGSEGHREEAYEFKQVVSLILSNGILNIVV